MISIRHIIGLSLVIFSAVITIDCKSQIDSLYIYSAPGMLLSTPMYEVEQIFEGPNTGAPAAVVVALRTECNENMLIQIKKEIIDSNITESNLRSAAFVFKVNNENIGVLFDYYTSEVRNDQFIPVDSLAHHASLKLEKVDLSGHEFLGLYTYLGHFESEGYKKYPTIFSRDLASGNLNFGRYTIELVDGKLFINTGNDETPFYEFEIMLQESGDIGFYSHRNKGFHNYYLKIK